MLPLIFWIAAEAFLELHRRLVAHIHLFAEVLVPIVVIWAFITKLFGKIRKVLVYFVQIIGRNCSAVEITLIFWGFNCGLFYCWEITGIFIVLEGFDCRKDFDWIAGLIILLVALLKRRLKCRSRIFIDLVGFTTIVINNRCRLNWGIILRRL